MLWPPTPTRYPAPLLWGGGMGVGMPHGGLMEDPARPVPVLGTFTPLHPTSISGGQLAPRERDPHMMWGWAPANPIPGGVEGQGLPQTVWGRMLLQKGDQSLVCCSEMLLSLYRLYPGNSPLD